MLIKQKSFIFSIIAIFLISACSPYSFDQGSIGQSQEYKIVYGYVSSMRPVEINSQAGATAGAVTGGILGAILGSLIGDGTGQLLAGATGAAVGAYGGGVIGNKVGGHEAFDITVMSDDNRAYSIIEHESINVSVGQRVRLLLGYDYSKIEPI